MQKLDYQKLADLLLGMLVVLALCVLASTYLASCAYREDNVVPHWSERQVPGKEDVE